MSTPGTTDKTMKTRNGFVSNSSSSSFVLTGNKDIEFFVSKGHATYGVDGLIEMLERLNVDIDPESHPLPYFIAQEISYTSVPYLGLLKNLRDKCPDGPLAITEAIDRDSEFLRDKWFEVFEGDL